jgi:hypothetical protein
MKNHHIDTKVENHHINTKVKNHHIDMKMKKIIAKKQAFNNSTLRQSSQFERVQMKTTMSNEMINSKTMLAVHRADSVSSRERDRERDKERDKERK